MKLLLLAAQFISHHKDDVGGLLRGPLRNYVQKDAFGLVKMEKASLI
jgi:hypothetical protein